MYNVCTIDLALQGSTFLPAPPHPLQTQIDKSPPTAFTVFFVLWILFAIGSAVFYRKASYRAKKFWHPFFVIGVGAAVLAYMELSTHGEIPILFPIMLVVITYLSLRDTRFCPKCNKTLYHRSWSRDKFCPKCGASLDDEPPKGNQPIE